MKVGTFCFDHFCQLALLFFFCPHACVALPLRRWIDVPVFIGANVVIDIEPLLVRLFRLNIPLK
jgi:hypothetical protein